MAQRHYQAGGPLAGVQLARVKTPEEEEKELMQRRQLQHAQFGPRQQSALGQVGDQVKGQLLSKATSFITKSLFGFQAGGQACCFA